MGRRQSMRRSTIPSGPAMGVALVFIAAALTLGCATRYKAGTRPWLEKPPEQWTKADAEQILNTSPWVRRAGKGVGGGYPDARWEFACSPSYPDGVDRCEHVARFGNFEKGQTIHYKATWESAETVCRAQSIGQEAAHCFHSGQHRISVSGMSLYTDSYLQLSSGKRIHKRDGSSFWFVFPVNNPDGTPTIDPSERWATLVAIGSNGKIKMKFDLRKMVTPRGRDL